jgi:putative transposase
MRSYSESVKADVRRRMSPPNRQSVVEIARELCIHAITLYKWRKAWRLQGEVYNSSGEDFVYGSERSFYRVLHAYGQAHRRGRARPPQEPRDVPRLEARGSNQLWSLDITYQPTSVRGVWHYLYLVIDVWSRKIVAWEVADREDSQLAADLVSRACLRERISKGRPHPLILHAETGNAMRAATMESRLEELGVLRSFSRPRVSNDNPFSESLFRTVKYRPDYPRRPFQRVEEACNWVAAFVEWTNHQHRHSGIRFVTPDQRHSGKARAISHHRAQVYENARQRHPRRWSRSTRCWRQPEVVWIIPPPPEHEPRSATLGRAALWAAEASSFLAVTALNVQKVDPLKISRYIKPIYNNTFHDL